MNDHEAMYVEITQNSVARLFFKTTPKNMKGFCTQRTERSILIIICGADGFSFIHTTGKLSSHIIADEFNRLGQIRRWTIAFDPKHYLSGTECHSFDFMDEIDLSSYDKPYFATLKTDTIWVGRTGELIQNKAANSILATAKNSRKRNFINFFNDYLQKDPPYVDIQFDGKDVTPEPKLLFTIEAMQQLAQLHITNQNETVQKNAYTFLAYLIVYVRLYEPTPTSALHSVSKPGQ